MLCNENFFKGEGAVPRPVWVGARGAFCLCWEVLGGADDAPGLSFIGLSVAFLLTMRGVLHAGVLPQGYCLPIILLAFGAVGVVMPFILLLDGELDGMLYLFVIGELMGVLLLTAGTKRLKKTQRTGKNTSQKNGDKI